MSHTKRVFQFAVRIIVLIIFVVSSFLPVSAQAQSIGGRDKKINLPSQSIAKGVWAQLSDWFFSSRVALQDESTTKAQDEESSTWGRLPLKSIDRETNAIDTNMTHFSTWSAGIGLSTPQNGANVLLYDTPYPDLFTGRVQYSLPIWTPPGRTGLAPSLALTYSSRTADGLLGDIQSSWVGMGWNIDSVEIARKITNGNCNPCGSGSYGYENVFLLLINGTGYELIPDGITPGRYHTKAESFLYIQLHNEDLGNNTPAAQNLSGEWWEVVMRDGTRWRLGWNSDSEQLGAMKDYPGTDSGTWSALGYAGQAIDVVAFRWRADLVTDTHGNQINFAYFEENRIVAGTSANYDRANYLDTITYTSHTSGNPAPGYSISFVRESRNGSDVPQYPTEWDNWDTYQLDRIEVKYGANIVRAYDLSFDVHSYSDDGTSWETMVLSSVAMSGGGTNAPTIAFTYTDEDNRANCGTGCQEWAYPRLTSISSGWGSTASYTFGNDGRSSASWYNWRVESLEISDGVNTNPMKTTYAYDTPCYYDEAVGWCNAGSTGELIGYGQTAQTTKNFDGASALATSVYKYHVDEQRPGLAYEAQNKDESGTTLSQTNTIYTVVTSGLPAGGYFTYASVVEQFLNSVRVSRTEYQYDSTTGNPMLIQEFDGIPTLYRQTEYSYVTNTSPSTWILDRVSTITLKDDNGGIVSEQQFGYDGNLPGNGSPSVGELTLSRVVDGGQTVDTAYEYDTYGNLIDTRLYQSYGTTGSLPVGTYLIYSIAYDSTLKTYPVSMTNPLSHVIQRDYDFGLGLATENTDPNHNTTTITYDGLGRVTTVTYPNYTQPNVKYIYAPPPVSAPFAVEAQAWDESASVYRSAWQIYDGLGRMIQTQGPAETAGDLILTDTSYDARGLTLYSGTPRNLTGTGGFYFAPSWGSIPHTTTGYDALGRKLSTAFADGSHETFSYSQLRTTVIDRNDHQKVREMDAFGRTVKVEEYTGSGPYSLYATTTYDYDVRNLLKQVTDAQGSQITINYNGFGRKVSMSDPDMGTWSYGYDVLGNLTSQTDARNCVTTVTYDELNRPIGKSYSGPGACATTPSVTYTYDSETAGNEGVGHRTGMTDGSGSTTWFYNELGQSVNETHNIDGTNYQLDYTFDAFNRPLTQTLPSSETLSYDYNAMGALSSLSGTSTYVSQIHYNASGQVIDQQLGNGLLQQQCYEADTSRLSAIRVYSGALQSCGMSPSNPKLDLSYTYEPNGNLSQMVDGTQNETIDYTYDELDRLLSVTGPNNKNYAYDTNGTITSLTTTPTLISVETGGLHNCALTADGGVKCWGANNLGQLGDGTTTDRAKPVDVSGLTHDVVAVTAGGNHSCALTTSGGVKCWGNNGDGQLGDGTTIMRTIPVDVSGLTSGVIAISAGAAHTCALTMGGGVKCWGDNGYSQLGDNSTKDRTTPVDVDGLSSGVSAIAAAGSHTCALTTGGGVKCWGENSRGQLGDGTTKDRKTPVDVSGLSSEVAAIAARGSHTCALTTSEGVKCWGNNLFGGLGDGTTTNRTTPVDVIGLTSGVTAITAGAGYTCALMASGGGKCWGSNASGQLGDGTTTDRTTPVDVVGLTDSVVAISASHYINTGHTCVLTTSGGGKCWGGNSHGELGNGVIGGHSTTPVDTDFGLVSSYSYDNHAVTALSSGETYIYDENGNMTERVEGSLIFTQTFDAENHLISVTVSGQTTQFVYDGNGNLVEKIKPDGSKTIYVDGVYEVNKNSSGVPIRTVSYYAAGGAIRVDGTMYYVLRDRLGSAYATTDASGDIVGETRYYASGEMSFSSGNMVTDRLFTGQRWMGEVVLYHYGARFYSPNLGRFISADPMGQSLANPQAWDRYSYALNNPLRYTDPTGYWVDEGCGYEGCSSSHNGTTTTSDTTGGSVTTTSGGGSGGNSEVSSGGSDSTTSTETSSTINQNLPIQDYLDTGSKMCSTNPDGCLLGGALLIVFTDLFVGLPAIAVIVLSGGVTPPAIAAEVLETVVVLPVNVFGVYLITQGLEAKHNEE